MTLQWLSRWQKKGRISIFTGGGNIVFDGIYGMPGCVMDFPLNDDMPLNVHPFTATDIASIYLDACVVQLRVFADKCFFFYVFLSAP